MARDIPRQIPLVLPHAPRFGAEDFLVTPANAAAHAIVTSWPRWPDRSLLLVGAGGAGKSHLAEIWRAASGAEAAASAEDAIERLRGGADGAALLLDDVDRDGADENALFHLLNLARERAARLLLTARQAPTLLWPTLPDLASRLRALPVARLEEPDDETVRAVLLKLLDDRQLKVEAGVIDYVARQCDRSLGAVRELVEALDRESLARGRSIGRGLAGDVLHRLRGDDD
ncbi:hypothetical protein ACFSCV_00630 [Methylopila henanensis]|uniref:Chromosomal replication initiator protein DnaA domain-containing protein n=1 Tax=Methylopila henanensis TaxID=873516 RepID=A0ABW4K493_9HYPH